MATYYEFMGEPLEGLPAAAEVMDGAHEVGGPAQAPPSPPPPPPPPPPPYEAAVRHAAEGTNQQNASGTLIVKTSGCTNLTVNVVMTANMTFGH